MKQVIGVSIYPDPSTTFDRTYWLVQTQGVPTNFVQAYFAVSQAPIGVAPNRVLYYYDPNTNRSYVSLWSSPLSPNNWSTWVWVDNNPVPTNWQLTSIGNRIDDLLATGELLSTQGNIATVYDPTTPTGTPEASFPLNDLRFIGEVYIGGTATVLFSQALWFGNQVTFNVYSIPTSRLKTLAQ